MSDARKLQRPEVQAMEHQFELYARPGRLVTALRTLRANPLGAVGATIILLMLLVAIFAPLLARYGINAYAGVPGQGPSGHNWFGTDRFGQDIYSRVVYGARISFQVGVLSVLLGVMTGLVVGSTSGYFGGWIDIIIQRFVDAAIAFPQLILLLIVVRTLGPSMRNVIIVIAIAIVPSTTRIIRGAALSEKNQLYVEAARSMGASDVRVVFRHVIPNVVPVAIVIATTLLGAAILAESALSFLGLGIPPPNPSWGVDISTSRSSFPINVWAALFPGIAISLTVLGFNFFGDTLRDILDPRLRGAR
jgi:ABC-type dipeptide/oligopeptide/nickel transport system permease subunit